MSKKKGNMEIIPVGSHPGPIAFEEVPDTNIRMEINTLPLMASWPAKKWTGIS